MRDIEIKGGANEFEAAVVAVVIDRIKREETAARQGRRDRGSALSAWVRVIGPEEPRLPRDQVWPD
jgi:hypothetical protein